MPYSIVENIRNHNEWDSVKGILTGIFKFIILIILIPILLISGLIGLIKNEKKEKQVNIWSEFYSSGKLKLTRIFIDENELPETLDYPEECNDLYLFKMKSEPKIIELEDKFIDYQFVTDENGVYLLSFNNENEGMTLWFINNENPKLEKIKDLKSSWWNFEKKDGKIILETTLEKQDIKIEIEKTGYNTVYT
jgi:hypothetical protein|tara:strand:+ start:271 stop:849 length:579 start_codon:yes stop_codon:yes gene_type:complete